MSNTATFIKKLDGFRGDARLYRCDPPMPANEYSDDKTPHEYVIVSASNILGPETYIFPASPEGEIANWSELKGSFQGDRNHMVALALAGYEVAK